MPRLSRHFFFCASIAAIDTQKKPYSVPATFELPVPQQPSVRLSFFLRELPSFEKILQGKGALFVLFAIAAEGLVARERIIIFLPEGVPVTIFEVTAFLSVGVLVLSIVFGDWTS